MKPLRIFWGLFILSIGVVLLLINANLIESNVWSKFTIFWPIVIVLFGLGLIVRNWIVYLCIAALLMAMTVYFAIADPFHWQKHEVAESQAAIPNMIENYDTSIDNYTVLLELGAAKLDVKALNEPNSFSLLKGNYGGINRFEEVRDNDGKTASISIKEKAQKEMFFDNGTSERFMDLNLTNQLPLEFTVNTGASYLNMDFSDIILKKLSVNAGASKVDIKLGNRADTIDANINCGASLLNFSLPKDYGVKILSNSVLLGRSFGELDMEQTKGAYTTKDFDQSAKKITINLSSGISKLTVTTY